MKLQREQLNEVEWYSGFVNKMTPTFGFLRIDNADPELHIFFRPDDCGSGAPFDQIHLNQRFKFGVKPSKTVTGGLCVSGMKREFPPAGKG